MNDTNSLTILHRSIEMAIGSSDHPPRTVEFTQEVINWVNKSGYMIAPREGGLIGPMEATAISLHENYSALVNAGFSEERAFELLTLIITHNNGGAK